MHKTLAILFLCLILLMPSVVFAQTSVDFSRVEVDLWPEFDRPMMLVINRLTLSSQTPLPAEVTIQIPVEAGRPNAVATRMADGSLINVNYTTQPAGDWMEINFQATTPELQVEYYDPSLKIDGTARHFEYRWPGDYAVASFVIQVQQPLGATGMQISPSLGPGNPAADGMVYYTSEVGPLTQGQSFDITVDYQKQGDDLSAGSVPLDPSGPLDDTAAGRMTVTSALPYLLGFAGVVLIGGGVFWYWRSGRETQQPSKRRRSRRKAGADESVAAASSGGYVYCHQCGKRAASGDRFCRVCGTQLRTG